MTHPRNDGITDINLKDSARTPPELFEKLYDKWHFDVDAAATMENSLCQFHFDDALDRPWFETDEEVLEAGPFNNHFYCNPPYSSGHTLAFSKKAHEESLKGAIVVMLLPADTSTITFHDYHLKAAEIIFLKPRVRFNNPDGTRMGGSPKFGSMLVVFDQQAREDWGLQVRGWDWKKEPLS